MSDLAEQHSPEDEEGLAEDPVSRWVTVCLDGETYGIEVTRVQEVLRVPEIAPVPGAPDYVLGIINLRGHVVTVIDTRRRFGLPPAEHTDQTRIVIAESEGRVFGMLVDSVAEVMDLRRSQIDSAPTVGNEEAVPYLQGLAQVDGELVILIDLDRVIAEEGTSVGLGF